MKTFTSEQYSRSWAFLSHTARPLERARGALWVNPGVVDGVVKELQPYRNDDGGFGRALEPDMRARDSSVLATLEALDILAESNVTPSHPMYREALSWLVEPGLGYDSERELWPYIPRSIDTAPHAPWWDADGLEDTFGGYRVNPRGRVLAHLASSEARKSVPAAGALVARHLPELLDAVDQMPDDAPPDTLRSLLSLHRALVAAGTPVSAAPAPTVSYPEAAGRLAAGITRMIPASVETRSQQWGTYGLQPLEVADAPDSPWLNLLEDSVSDHLDYIVDHCSQDGSWKPFWNWGGRYPDIWKQAAREWSGVLVLKNLRRLVNFERVPPEVHFPPGRL